MSMQVRCFMTSPPDGYGTQGATYLYFENTSARRAAELAAQHMAARCIAVDYFEVIDDCYDYDSPPVLVADWQGRPAITVRVDLLAA